MQEDEQWKIDGLIVVILIALMLVCLILWTEIQELKIKIKNIEGINQHEIKN
jgi:hypothetical protein